MSSPRQDDPRKREESLARALAEALRSTRPSANNVSGAEDCPDAEVIAAYADRGLAEDEIARWEEHFAACAHCQRVLAVLGVTTEPLAPVEVERLGELAASATVALPAAAASSAAPQPAVALRRRDASAPVRRPTLWRFLAPAAGVAAALALWFVLRPPAPAGNNSAQLSQAKTAAQPAAPPAPAPSDTQMAEANIPPPPSSATGVQSAPRETESSAPSDGVSPAKNEATQADEVNPAAAEPSAAPQSVRELPLSRRDGAELQSGSAGGAVESGKGISGALGPGTSGSNEQSASAGAAPTPPQEAARRAAAPSAPAPPAALGGAFGASGLRALNKMAAPAARAWLDTFELLDGSVSWRVGTGGRIERSTDQGQTWQAQTSGVTTDLVEGTAVSDKVAWVVGNAGVILRTTDGEHWQRTALPASLPAGAPPDWMLVQARDALRATIVSTGGGAFSTRDGGATWVASGPPMQ